MQTLTIEPKNTFGRTSWASPSFQSRPEKLALLLSLAAAIEGCDAMKILRAAGAKEEVRRCFPVNGRRRAREGYCCGIDASGTRGNALQNMKEENKLQPSQVALRG